MRTTLALMTILAAGFTGCAPPAATPGPSSQTATSGGSAQRGPVIVKIVSRHYTIVVASGPKKPVYTVTNAAGKIMSDGLTLDQLRWVNNDLYQEIAPALAPNARADASQDSSLLVLARD